MKSIKHLPGPKGWPLLGIFPEYAQNGRQLFKLEQQYSDNFGPIHKEQLLNRTLVVLSSPEYVEQLVRSECIHPLRPPVVAWEAHRDICGVPRGLVTSSGEEWRRCRSTFSKPLLKPTEVKQYRDVVKSSLEKFSIYIDQNFLASDNRDHLREKPEALDLLKLLKIWSLEVICSITFGKNQQLLKTPIEKETTEFLHAIDQIFDLGLIYFFVNPEMGTSFLKLTQKRSRLLNRWNFIFEFCRPHILQKLEDVRSKFKGEQGKPRSISEDGFLEMVLSDNVTLSDGEIQSCVTEIILGAIDQTSLVLSEILGEIAMNKDLQSKLRDEISSMKEDQSNSFLKAVLKEGFRMFPSMTRTIRMNPNTIQIGEYELPPTTAIMMASYAIGRNPNYFENPDSFDPERWLRTGSSYSPFLVGTFGFGARMCIGKRLAEMQIYEALIFILKNYRLTWDSDTPMQLYSNPLLAPVDISPLTFHTHPSRH